MNGESNKEIDILLRTLGGKQNGKLTADGNSDASVEEHLDADELNAYAEQALPAMLRAKYTEHLADCSRCRSIVTQLSLSLPPMVSRNVAEQPTRWSWKTFLAGLFSPLVIRYAVPAMAGIMVVALAWIVLWRPAGNVEVARNAETTSAPSAGIVSDDAPSPGLAETAVATQPDAKQEVKNKPANVSKEEAAPTDTTASTAPSKAPDELKDSQERAKLQEPPPATVNPTATSAVAVGGAAPAPKPATQADENKTTDQKKLDSDLARNQAPTEPERARAAKAGPSQPAKAESRDVIAGRTNESVRALSSQRAARAEAKQKDKEQARDDEAEIRTVAGHRFARRGKVWIDLLYDSDRSTVNVSRGSDQYRALVGDEPGLRTITEQLSGEIIVVWKNRAYRIR
jgi:hypothetical protein